MRLKLGMCFLFTNIMALEERARHRAIERGRDHRLWGTVMFHGCGFLKELRRYGLDLSLQHVCFR